MGILFDEKYAGFQLFGPVHIAVLVLAAAAIVALYYLRGPLANPTVGRIFRYTVATLLVIAQVSFKIWALRRGELHWVDTIPLGLCDMMQWITLVALYFDLAV
jgi:uncharacterized membrane protein YwaF